jgi:hypothetical protein
MLHADRQGMVLRTDEKEFKIFLTFSFYFDEKTDELLLYQEPLNEFRVEEDKKARQPPSSAPASVPSSASFTATAAEPDDAMVVHSDDCPCCNRYIGKVPDCRFCGEKVNESIEIYKKLAPAMVEEEFAAKEAADDVLAFDETLANNDTIPTATPAGSNESSTNTFEEREALTPEMKFLSAHGPNQSNGVYPASAFMRKFESNGEESYLKPPNGGAGWSGTTMPCGLSNGKAYFEMLVPNCRAMVLDGDVLGTDAAQLLYENVDGKQKIKVSAVLGHGVGGVGDRRMRIGIQLKLRGRFFRSK